MTPVAYVSGGGSGIGRAVAGTLAADGWHVVVLGRRGHRLVETAEQVRAATPGARVDAVVTAAGGVSPLPG